MSEPWVLAEHRDGRPKTNFVELLMPSLLAFDEPTRERWVAALNANEVDLRLMQPDPDLDPDDSSIPDERFELQVQAHLNDGIEDFSSVQFPLSSLGRYIYDDDDPA